jgi:hypothetical protein
VIRNIGELRTSDGGRHTRYVDVVLYGEGYAIKWWASLLRISFLESPSIGTQFFGPAEMDPNALGTFRLRHRNDCIDHVFGRYVAFTIGAT